MLASHQQRRASLRLRALLLPAIAITLLCAAAGSAAGSRPVYTVQVGSFAQETNAKSMRDRLDDHYTDVTLLSDRVNGQVVYRVLSGRFATQLQADARRTSLMQLGFDTFVRRLDGSPMRAVSPPPYRPAWKIVADQIDAGLRPSPEPPEP